MLLSTIFQLTGALILVNFFGGKSVIALPVSGQKPHDLQKSLQTQLNGVIASTYLVIGYFLPLIDKDIKISSKTVIITLAVFGIVVLFTLCILISRPISKWLYEIAPVMKPPTDFPEYNIWNIIYRKYLKKQ